MRILVLAFVCASALACAGGGSPGAPAPDAPPEVRAAPGQVVVDGRTYALVADLGRDVMPRVGPPAPPSGMQGTIFLRAEEPSDAPQGLRVDGVWLLKGTDAWEGMPQPLQTLTVDRRFHLSLGLRDGPAWDVGSSVDVVLRFSAGGRTYLIAARGITVMGYA